MSREFAGTSEPRDVLEWNRPHVALTPERMLALAVLGEAMKDVRNYRARTAAMADACNAAAWIRSDDRSWPFAFIPVCEFLGLDPEYLRDQLFEELEDIPRRPIRRAA